MVRNGFLPPENENHGIKDTSHQYSSVRQSSLILPPAERFSRSMTADGPDKAHQLPGEDRLATIDRFPWPSDPSLSKNVFSDPFLYWNREH